MDELVKRAREELEPPWDDLREARVLARVLEHDIEAPKRSWAPIWLMSAAGAVVLVLSVLFIRGSANQVQVPSVAAGQSAKSPAVAATASVLALADGSKAHLQPGAEVRALEQSTGRVRLLQPAGEVRYDVRSDPLRPFSVVASGVEVHVLGTLFTVAVEQGGVRVSVERGHVSVRNGARAVTLAAGESVRLSQAEVPPAHLAAAVPPAPSEVPPIPAPTAEKALETADTWLARADRARAAGDLAAAENALRRVVSEHASSPQAMSAAFSLGRVQNARGNFAAAARTFEGLRQRAPTGPLAEDALAEAANAWALGGNSARARALAAEYLARYPRGTHAERMKRFGSR